MAKTQPWTCYTTNGPISWTNIWTVTTKRAAHSTSRIRMAVGLASEATSSSSTTPTQQCQSDRDARVPTTAHSPISTQAETTTRLRQPVRSATWTDKLRPISICCWTSEARRKPSRRGIPHLTRAFSLLLDRSNETSDTVMYRNKCQVSFCFLFSSLILIWPS